MKIGDGVLVSAVCKPEYDLDGNRTVFRYPCEPFAANITGIKHVKLGKYVGGSMYGRWDEPGGFDPPELQVTGSRRLLAIKVGLLNKEILADPADTTPCEYESPLRGKNPVYTQVSVKAT
jgi:hypothetical protein